MALAVLTDEQRLAALDRATAARRRRAEVKVELKNKELSLAEFFDMADEDQDLAQMRAIDLLKSLPRVGALRAQLLMEEIDIAPSRRVRGIGQLQREALITRMK